MRVEREDMKFEFGLGQKSAEFGNRILTTATKLGFWKFRD